MKKRISIVVLLIVAVLISNGLYGRYSEKRSSDPNGMLGFLVTQCEGRVITRAPMSTRWLPLKKGAFVPDHHLIQVTKEGHLELLRAEKDMETKTIKRITGENSGVKVHLPAIIRTGPALLRHIELSKYFVEEMPKIANDLKEKKSELYFDEAWKRLAAVFTGRTDLSNLLGEDSGDGSPQSSGGFGRLDLISPTKGAYIERDRLPTDIDVAWSPDPKRKGTKVKYKIYLWEAGTTRNDPVARTSSESYRLSVASSGEYMLQVESDDGQSRSIPHKVFIADKRSNKTAKMSLSSKIELDAKLYSPPPGEIILSNRPTTPVRFTWRLLFPSEERLVLIIRRANKVIIRDPVGHRISKSHALPAGSYTWQLVWANPSDHKGIEDAASEKNSFTIKANDSVSVTSTVQSLMLDAKSGPEKTVVFVDHW